jgi:dienelactone hydrolase
MIRHRSLAGLLLATVLGTALPASAEQGPYASTVVGPGGFVLDLDIRWPDGAPPAGGWPAVFFAHGSGGDKTSNAGNATRYANDGYVALTWTGRSVATQPTPATLAGDVVALKQWVVSDFQAEAGVTVPVDPDRFGLTGGSLGGYVSWSGGILTDEFATVVPFGWGFHFFTDGLVLNGSIDRRTGGPLASLLPAPYDAAGLAGAVDAVFGSAVGAMTGVTIPVMTQMALMDARTGGTYALRDYQALTSAVARAVYLGTGGHGTPETDGEFRADLRDRWFAHYLKDEDNGIDSELPIQIALLGTNERLAYATLPTPTPYTVWLRSGGVLAATAPVADDAPETIVNDPGAFGWANAVPSFQPGPIRNAVSKDTATWQTAPLTDDVLLLGDPGIRLEAAGTGSRYQVNVHLFDLVEGEDPLLISWGTATVGVSPAVIDVPLALTARRVPAGHSLRLEVTNRDDQDLDYTNGSDPESDALRYIPFFEFSNTSVFQDVLRPSSLTLPLADRIELPLPGVACDPEPRAGCRLPTVASPLVVNDHATADANDSFSWKWSKGAATAFADLGDPATGDGFVFCVYDGSGVPASLVLEARAPAAGTCGTKPCWKQKGSPAAPKGWGYADKDATPDGVRKLKVQAGEAAKAKARVRGKGENLGASGHFPTLPLALPVVAQLQTATTCWEASYPTATQNTPERFKAR